jgi:uncharacterized protein YcbK (DUF882 family)
MLWAGIKVQSFLLPRRARARTLFLFGLAAIAAGPLLSSRGDASDDSRTLTIFHTHTQESATVTFRRAGSYVPDGLQQLNSLLRDWRVEQSTQMDPRLFDIMWEMHRATGSRSPIHIISAYRSPQTNQALRSRSRAVSEQSQHMLGRAIDIRFPDVDAARVREAAMRLQHGGVGFYPGANFVHVDVGSVRSWPRMTREQLVRLFPDGKTVHLPADGNPLAGYEQARTEISSRSTSFAGGEGLQRRSLWASLFGERERLSATPEKAAETAPSSPVLAYAPLPPPRPPTTLHPPATAGASDPAVRADPVTLSSSQLAGLPQTRELDVSLNPVPAQPVPSEVPIRPFTLVQAPPGGDPDMERAKSNLARALAERAKALREQHTAASEYTATLFP